MERGTILSWYLSLPLITRSYLTGILVVASLCQLGYVGALQLYFNYKLVFQRHQWWRLITPFLYFGPVNFDFLFHMFFLMRYCRVLEEESFRNKPADFLFMLLFGSIIMLGLGPILRVTFLSTSLTFMIVYVWARRNPQVLMNFLGVFNFTAPFMPWVLLGFSLLLSGQLPIADLIGIGAGHAYYYLMDIYPILYGTRPLSTPTFLSTILNPPPEDPTFVTMVADLERENQNVHLQQQENHPTSREDFTTINRIDNYGKDKDDDDGKDGGNDNDNDNDSSPSSSTTAIGGGGGKEHDHHHPHYE